MKAKAETLHAGDWIACPEGLTGGCWVSNRRQEGDEMHFILGRGPGHVHRDVVMTTDEEVTVMYRWPEAPPSVGKPA